MKATWAATGRLTTQLAMPDSQLTHPTASRGDAMKAAWAITAPLTAQQTIPEGRLTTHQQAEEIS